MYARRSSLSPAAAVLLLLGLPAARAGVLEPLLLQQGVLDRNDQVLPDGSYADVYPIEVQVGDRLMIEMESRKFDTFLAIKLPSGEVLENDDLAGDAHRSQVDVFAEEAGTWLVYATSHLPKQKGKYQLRVAVDSSGRRGGTTPIAAGSTVQGVLQAGDHTLPAREWADIYTIEVQAGQHLTVDMTSDTLDTYVVVRSPSGSADGNDDHEGSNRRSRYEITAEESGTWEVFATTYSAGDGGAYSLSVDAGAPPSSAANRAGEAERWSDTLGPGDTTITSGEYADLVSVEGQAGERWVIDLRSTAFDPFLIVRSPSGEQEENDDFEGDSSRSLLDLTLSESGSYMIVPTTYRPGETGRYDLTLRRISDAVGGEAASEHRRLSGRLEAGDMQLREGEWYDTYEFVGLPGQPLRAQLTGDFDTYLGIAGPGGFQMENDDADGGSPGSVIEAVLTEAGTYTAIVTSYAPGQGGSYALTLNQSAAPGQSEEAAGQRDVRAVTFGTPVQGVLEEGDLTLGSGEFQDRYVLDVEAGQHVSVSLRSSAFDPYVGLVLPDDSVVENDDFEGDGALARVDLVAPESGRYRVVATSYRAGEVGEYMLRAEVLEGSASVSPVASATGGQIYGLFVGISDYPEGGPTDLDFTADDARNLYEGLQRVGMRPEDGHLLLDDAATRPALLAALQDLGQRMTDKDVLVLFYSGHGGRIESNGEQVADPDGFDETLALYDGQLRDDDLAAALAEVQQGTVLVVLDSCFSGGFSKDLISRPGRMGLFSSYEDVTSSVALKFRAGGYLSRFMVEAVGERLADEDHNGQLTALELSQYLYERYRDDVKSSPLEETKSGGAYDGIVMSSRNLGYQQIVVDRGGVGAYQILFAW